MLVSLRFNEIDLAIFSIAVHWRLWKEGNCLSYLALSVLISQISLAYLTARYEAIALSFSSTNGKIRERRFLIFGSGYWKSSWKISSELDDIIVKLRNK